MDRVEEYPRLMPSWRSEVCWCMECNPQGVVGRVESPCPRVGLTANPRLKTCNAFGIMQGCGVCALGGCGVKAGIGVGLGEMDLNFYLCIS